MCKKCNKCGGSGIYSSEHGDRCWECGGSGKKNKALHSKFDNELVTLITDTFGFELNMGDEIVGDEYKLEVDSGGKFF